MRTKDSFSSKLTDRSLFSIGAQKDGELGLDWKTNCGRGWRAGTGLANQLWLRLANWDWIGKPTMAEAGELGLDWQTNYGRG